MPVCWRACGGCELVCGEPVCCQCEHVCGRHVCGLCESVCGLCEPVCGRREPFTPASAWGHVSACMTLEACTCLASAVKRHRST
eukprot:281251-Chlamydomonas_euryale.AAC.1